MCELCGSSKCVTLKFIFDVPKPARFLQNHPQTTLHENVKKCNEMSVIRLYCVGAQPSPLTAIKPPASQSLFDHLKIDNPNPVLVCIMLTRCSINKACWPEVPAMF